MDTSSGRALRQSRDCGANEMKMIRKDRLKYGRGSGEEAKKAQMDRTRREVVQRPLWPWQDFQVCTMIWPSVAAEIVWDVLFVVLDFLIPGLSIVIGYTKIFKVTKETRRNLTMSTAYVESQQLLVSQKDYKLFRTLLVLMCSFFLMWSPIVITVLLILVRNFKQDFQISSTFFFWIMTFTFANSALNPILYNVSDVRHKWWQVICCRLSDKKMDSSDTTVPKNEKEQPDLAIIAK
ncbi:hypothetical protein NDU88_007956 [Pleurodeles waltl]|uniref:G-protein coupled receptors family 1 profile domain-containing protein n=1 Tax=Pleurodeles waltl TaxID=8319 RepID=A0AAV7QTD5_PLEWA|nr:hypothetical protein NDU88_007956 [Pleurodeles waltl]